MWFIGVEVEQETSAPPHKKKKNPGSAPAFFCLGRITFKFVSFTIFWGTLSSGVDGFSQLVHVKS